MSTTTTVHGIESQDRKRFDALSPHPLQSWQWGEFRKKLGIEVIRLGRYQNERLIETAQITIHPIPFTDWTIGYFPKGALPSEEMLHALTDIGRKHRCIFIKLEPNVLKSNLQLTTYLHREASAEWGNLQLPIHPSPHPLFTKYTFLLDLTKSEEELLNGMHPKTRYNIKVARKYGVSIQEDNSNEAFEKYLELTFETTKRQRFFAHNRRYHQLMWETLAPAGIAHLLTATYSPSHTPHASHSDTLVTWIVFLFNNVLYYPYGASSNFHRNTMASNLMMWETIRFGKQHGATSFDMWGALGPNPKPSDPWYGFHKFKMGYGALLTEFVGSFDLVIQPTIYRVYNVLYQGRQLFLYLKSFL